MSGLIELNYWAIGRHPGRPDIVEVSGETTVTTLKDKIRNAHQSLLAGDFDLWKVSTTIHLGETDKMLHYCLKDEETTREGKVSELFPDPQTHDCLHLIVRPHVLRINCFIQHLDMSLPVQVPSSDPAYSVKKAIKAELPISWEFIPAAEFSLWKVLVPVDGNLNRTAFDNLQLEHEIGSGAELSRAFQYPYELDSHYIHVFVTVTLSPFIQLMKERAEWLDLHPEKSPLLQGKSMEFAIAQEVPRLVTFNRPPEASAVVPITLYEKVFADFQDDCESCITTVNDHKFASKLSYAMSGFYSHPYARASVLRSALEEYGLDYGSDEFTTGGLLRCGDCFCSILEYKMEVDHADADPLLQAACRYANFYKDQLLLAYSHFPCFIVYGFGAYIGFAGVLWTDKPHLQVLAPILPLFSPESDTTMWLRVARHFAAAKKAIMSLKDYYDREQPKTRDYHFQSSYRPAIGWPYPRSFIPIDGGPAKSFEYRSSIGSENPIFYGTTIEEQQSICIKFVRQYSMEAHLLCSSIGFAPALYGFMRIAGGWYMVVMECLGVECRFLKESPCKESFRSEIEEKVRLLHQAGYVHGDIRAENILTKINKEGGVKLLDFDWAGKIGEIRYPMNVNNVDILRPDGAIDNELILPEHDMAMIEFIFRGT